MTPEDVIDRTARLLYDNNHLSPTDWVDAFTIARALADKGLLANTPRQEPLPGRTEAQVKAEALREESQHLRERIGDARNARSRFRSTTPQWEQFDREIHHMTKEANRLALRADRIEGGATLTAEPEPAPRPLWVGDRVRIVTPERTDGSYSAILAAGDICTVTKGTDSDGTLRVRRDGTTGVAHVAAANVERIEDET